LASRAELVRKAGPYGDSRFSQRIPYHGPQINDHYLKSKAWLSLSEIGRRVKAFAGSPLREDPFRHGIGDATEARGAVRRMLAAMNRTAVAEHLPTDAPPQGYAQRARVSSASASGPGDRQNMSFNLARLRIVEVGQSGGSRRKSVLSDGSKCDFAGKQYSISISAGDKHDRRHRFRFSGVRRYKVMGGPHEPDERARRVSQWLTYIRHAETNFIAEAPGE